MKCPCHVYYFFVVLALNFPARGRKPKSRWTFRSRLPPFWPLISPQGDGNTATSKVRMRQYAFVLALNFPARGRKLEFLPSSTSEQHEEFWPLISPQGDGNEEEYNKRYTSQLPVLALNFPARGRKHPRPGHRWH